MPVGRASHRCHPFGRVEKWRALAMERRDTPGHHVRAMTPFTPKVCPCCSTGDLVTITLTVQGNELSFTTCHACEAKWWYRDGEPLALQSVIALMGQP